MNTDGNFWAIKTVAIAADNTGKFRAEIAPLSELYNWAASERAELVTLAKSAFRDATILGPMSEAEWENAGAIGYCDTNHATASMTIRSWGER